MRLTDGEERRVEIKTTADLLNCEELAGFRRREGKARGW